MPPFGNPYHECVLVVSRSTARTRSRRLLKAYAESLPENERSAAENLGGLPLFAKHFDGKRFFNPDAPQARGVLDALRWKLTSRAEASPRFVADVEQTKPPDCVDGDELRVTLINHSTVLLQQRGSNILTDPVWSERASPLSWAGPRRRRLPGVRWDDLPRIDIVLLSHNHYDHLDIAVLHRLADRGQSRFFAPIGVGKLLRSHGIGPFTELDWGQSLTLDQTTIHSVPALHFSARGVFDRNKTLWCGYLAEAANGIVYFAGDTAFGSHFASIRARFGAPRVALLPIGAYEPRWFMSPVHMAPEDAINAHRILGAHTSIAIHHGTFQLTDESIDTPQRRLRECAGHESFVILRNGQSMTFA
jgi:L-ascorbate metabolism protein UlaG (beta-lactamase superfamily)